VSAVSGKNHKTEEAKQAAIARLREHRSVPFKERTRLPSQLPKWVKRAIHLHDTLGLSWRRVCKHLNKNPATLAKYISTDGARELRKHIAEVADDPVTTARLIARHSAPEILYDAFEQLRIAQKSQDLAEAGRMIRWLGEITDLKPPANAAPVAPMIIVNLQNNGQTIESATVIPEGESIAVKVIEAEIVNE
jgi:hypothetical protein